MLDSKGVMKENNWARFVFQIFTLSNEGDGLKRTGKPEGKMF